MRPPSVTRRAPYPGATAKVSQSLLDPASGETEALLGAGRWVDERVGLRRALTVRAADRAVARSRRTVLPAWKLRVVLNLQDFSGAGD